MKLTIVILFVSLLQVSTKVYSQGTKFNLNIKNKRIVEVLKEIEESSKYRFFYIREQVNVERVVSIKANQATIDDILEEITEWTERRNGAGVHVISAVTGQGIDKLRYAMKDLYQKVMPE